MLVIIIVHIFEYYRCDIMRIIGDISRILINYRIPLHANRLIHPQVSQRRFTVKLAAYTDHIMRVRVPAIYIHSTLLKRCKYAKTYIVRTFGLRLGSVEIVRAKITRDGLSHPHPNAYEA